MGGARDGVVEHWACVVGVQLPGLVTAVAILGWLGLVVEAIARLTGAYIYLSLTRLDASLVLVFTKDSNLIINTVDY